MEVMGFPHEVQEADRPGPESLPTSIELTGVWIQEVRARLGKIAGQLTLDSQPVPETIPVPAEL